jgi:hypothetical protein
VGVGVGVEVEVLGVPPHAKRKALAEITTDILQTALNFRPTACMEPLLQKDR